jgi:leucyl aminopeptidase
MTITVTPTVPSLSYKTGNPLTAYVNAVVVGLSSDGQLSVVSDSISKAAATKIAAAFKEVGATGALDEVTRIPAGTLADAEVIVGVGLGSTKNPISHERLRRASGSAVRSLGGFKKVAIAITVDGPLDAGALLEGAAFGSYAFTEHRSATLKKAKAPVASIALFTAKTRTSEYRDALHRAQVLSEGINFARNLINA